MRYSFLKESLAKTTLSIRRIAKLIGVNASDIVNLKNGRTKKVGRATRKLIRTWMIENGFLPAVNRKPPVCRTCGTAYPTRRPAAVPPTKGDSMPKNTTAR